MAMRARGKRIALSLALTALPFAAHAIDVIDVWHGALAHDPEFAAARAAHEAGIAQRTQAGALWRPTVVLEGGAGRAEADTAVRGARFAAPGFGQTTGVAFDTSVNNGTSTRYGLVLRQPLLDRERDVQSRQLEAASDAAELQWLQDRQALMQRSVKVYFDTVLAAEQLYLIERQQTAVNRTLTEAQDRFRLGDRPVTDVHEATARAAALQAQRLAAQTELETRQVALADLSGLQTAGQALPRPAAAAPAEALAGVNAWLDFAAEGNLRMRLAQVQLQRAEQEARRTSAALQPTLEVVAQVGRDRLSGNGDFGSASNTANNRSIGVQLSVPLYTGGLRSARQTEAAALVDKARAELELARQEAAQRTRSAWLELAAGSSRIAALQAAADASRARLDATHVGVQAGDRTTLDLLNAENDAAAADFALLQARTQLLTIRLSLAALAGQLDEGRLSQVNALLQPPR
jgi:outer membrane protein